MAANSFRRIALAQGLLPMSAVVPNGDPPARDSGDSRQRPLRDESDAAVKT